MSPSLPVSLQRDLQRLTSLQSRVEADAKKQQCSTDLHDGQKRYIWAKDKANRLARQVALCSPRRFGKTEGFLRYAGAKAATEQRYRAIVIYQQRTDAREIAWPIIEELADKYGWNAKLNSVEMAVRFHDTQGVIKCFGADDPRRHRQFRGQKNDDVLIDEGQDWYSDLRSLIRGIVPGLADRNGRIFLVGTPGPMPDGYFFEATSGVHPEWTTVQASSFENPYTRDELQAQVDIYKEANPDIESEPWVQREYYGRWVPDTRANICHVSPKLNYLHEWQREDDDNFLLGIDWGEKATAFLVATYNPRRYPWLIYLEGQIAKGGVLSEHLDWIKHYQERYRGVRIIADPGGMATALTRELVEVHGIPIERAQKEDKRAQIDLMNMGLTTGQIKLYNTINPTNPHEHLLAQQWRELVWVVNQRTRRQEEGKPRDLHDCALYLRRYAHPHLWRRPEEKPSESKLIVDGMRERAAAKAARSRRYG